MNIKYILPFDNSKGIALPNHEMVVLKKNEDFTYSMYELPIVIYQKLSEYQETVGRIAYVLDPVMDKNFIDNFNTDIKELEVVGENKYNFITTYKRGSVDVKTSSKIPSVEMIIPNKKYAKYTDVVGKIPCNDLHILVYNIDNTVSIIEPPITMNCSIAEYEFLTGNVFVSDIDDQMIPYVEDSVIELETTECNNKFNIINKYKKGKVKVKNSSVNSIRVN